MKENKFFLMNKDERILQFNLIQNNENESDITDIVIFGNILPIGFQPTRIKSWITARKAPRHRANIKELLEKYNCDTLEGFIKVTHALSLNDTYWIKEANSELSWDDVSLYTNDFDDVIAKIAFEGGDSMYLPKSPSPEFSTDGAYAKCWIKEGNEIYLIKAGSKDGVEPYSEFLASQLANLICRYSVPYDIVVYHNKITGKCPLFTTEDIGFAPAWKFAGGTNIQELLDFYKSIGCSEQFKEMLVLDAVILNIDRHGGNHGVLVDNKTQNIIDMAPVFDHNRSLLYQMKDFELGFYEYLVDDLKPCIGDNFVQVAREVITPKMAQKLQDIHGFSFAKHSKYNLPEERVRVLEQIVNDQIEKIVKGKFVNINK